MRTAIQSSLPAFEYLCTPAAPNDQLCALVMVSHLPETLSSS